MSVVSSISLPTSSGGTSLIKPLASPYRINRLFNKCHAPFGDVVSRLAFGTLQILVKFVLNKVFNIESRSRGFGHKTSIPHESASAAYIATTPEAAVVSRSRVDLIEGARSPESIVVTTTSDDNAARVITRSKLEERSFKTLVAMPVQ